MVILLHFRFFGSYLILFSIAKTIERYKRRVKEIGLNHKRDDNSQVIRTLSQSLIYYVLNLSSFIFWELHTLNEYVSITIICVF